MSQRTDLIKEVRSFLVEYNTAKFDAMQGIDDYDIKEGQGWMVDGINELIENFDKRFPIEKSYRWVLVFTNRTGNMISQISAGHYLTPLGALNSEYPGSKLYESYTLKGSEKEL